MTAGDNALALHHVENSLRLSHNQPEIIRLREELKSNGSTSSSDYERSMMRRMLEKTLSDGESVQPPSVIETEGAEIAPPVTPSAPVENSAANANQPLSIEPVPVITANASMDLNDNASTNDSTNASTGVSSVVSKSAIFSMAPRGEFSPVAFNGFVASWNALDVRAMADGAWTQIAMISDHESE